MVVVVVVVGMKNVKKGFFVEELVCPWNQFVSFVCCFRTKTFINFVVWSKKKVFCVPVKSVTKCPSFQKRYGGARAGLKGCGLHEELVTVHQQASGDAIVKSDFWQGISTMCYKFQTNQTRKITLFWSINCPAKSLHQTAHLIFILFGQKNSLHLRDETQETTTSEKKTSFESCQQWNTQLVTSLFLVGRLVVEHLEKFLLVSFLFFWFKASIKTNKKNNHQTGT